MNATAWQHSKLEGMREIGDPEADALVASLCRESSPYLLHEVMTALTNPEEPLPAHVPPQVHQYLTRTSRLPAWVDHQQIALGEKVFNRHGPEIVLLLLCASLPMCFACQKGAEVLRLTQRLSAQELKSRIFETAQFVLDIMAPGGLGPNGGAVRSIQKVRLIHALVRHRIQALDRERGVWDQAWGAPINQEDLAGTLMAFSIIVIRGLERLGIRLKPDEAAAYLHIWNVVGVLLGVDPALLPRDTADADRLTQAIFSRQAQRSCTGSQLTQALIEFMQSNMPKRLFGGVPSATIRYLLGEDIADMLEIPRPSKGLRALVVAEKQFLSFVGALKRSNAGIENLASHICHLMLQGAVALGRARDQPKLNTPVVA